MGIDGDLLKRYTMATWGYKQGEMVSLMIHLGGRLGLYQALDGAGPVTSGDLAATTGLHERWLREWLRARREAKLKEIAGMQKARGGRGWWVGVGDGLVGPRAAARRARRGRTSRKCTLYLEHPRKNH